MLGMLAHLDQSSARKSGPNKEDHFISTAPSATPSYRLFPSAVLMVSKLTWCLTSKETVRLIRDGEKGGRGYGGGGERENLIPIATLSPPE